MLRVGFSESADRGLSNAELAVSSGVEGQRLHGRGGERGRRLPPAKSVSCARRRAGRERGSVGGESGLRHVREKAVRGRFTHCALCVVAQVLCPAAREDRARPGHFEKTTA